MLDYRVSMLFLAACFLTCSAIAESSQKVSHSESLLQNQPIVIHTQAQNYEKPILSDYQMCHTNRDNCIQVCQVAANQAACEAECPTCPILIAQDVMVQGINDTDSIGAPSSSRSGNTTNVIRLTNEIRNIIDYNSGNVTVHNESNIQIHHNASTTGGQFGLGYNQNGSCCIVVRIARSCAREQFPAAARCHQKRHHVCGKRCTARVLIARRVSKCEEIDGEQKCRESITYEPYRKSTAAASRQRKHFNCYHAPNWPFVECRDGRGGYANMCQRCYELPYINVIQQRVPPSCFQCYNFLPATPYYGPLWPYYTAPMYGPGPAHHPPPADEYDYEEFLPGDGWALDGGTTSKKIIEHNNNVFGDDGDYKDFDFEMQDYEDAVGGVQGTRRRRHSAKEFRRSRYSLRHRKHFS